MQKNFKKLKRISISEDAYNRLRDDRQYFQKKIGGCIWSNSDAILEYQKIVKGLKDEPTKSE